jgi:hypothetical protein
MDEGDILKKPQAARCKLPATSVSDDPLIFKGALMPEWTIVNTF